MEGSAICPSFAQSDKKIEIGADKNSSDEAQNSLTEEELKMVARDRIELSTLRFSVVARPRFRSGQDCSHGTFCRICGAKTEICDSVTVQDLSRGDRILQPQCNPRGRVETWRGSSSLQRRSNRSGRRV